MPPSAYADWDTNGTNTIPVVSGHATDGWAVNEIPSSSEMNKWMGLVGQWIRYFKDTVYTMVIPCAAGMGAELTAYAANSDVSAGDVIVDIAGSIGPFLVPITLPIGATIKAIRARVKDYTTPNPVQLTAEYSTDGAGTDFGGGTVASAGSGTWQTLTRSSLTEVVTSGRHYYARLNRTAGGTGNWVHYAHVEVDFISP